MQRFENSGAGSEVPVAVDLNSETGPICETTRRIVIVSPFPASVRSLFVALTIRCFDVLVFHHEDDPVLQTMDSDLMIIDRTKGILSSPIDINTTSDRRILFLCKEVEADCPHSHVLVWPCPIEQAVEKIEKLVIRNDSSEGQLSGGDLLRYKDLVMDLKKITLRQCGNKVDLTKTEFDLLKGLLLNGGVMSRDELMSFVWGDSYFGGSNSIDVHIKSLRRKLGDDPRKSKYIATVRGIGYRIAD